MNKPTYIGNITKTLLIGGILAGPLYLVVGLIEAFTRDGFEITRHDLSLLSNGDYGWVHTALFIVSGLLVVGASVGMKKVITTGRGRVWAPLLLGLYGLGLIGAGIFAADPSSGFPPGTPDGMPSSISFAGIMHFVTAGIGFVGLIAVCFVMASRFNSFGQKNWKIFSWVTGVVFLLGFIGIASGSGSGWTILGFWIAVILSWVWISAVSNKLIKEL